MASAKHRLEMASWKNWAQVADVSAAHSVVLDDPQEPAFDVAVIGVKLRNMDR